MRECHRTVSMSSQQTYRMPMLLGSQLGDLKEHSTYISHYRSVSERRGILTKSISFIYNGDLDWDLVLRWLSALCVVEASKTTLGKVKQCQSCAQSAVRATGNQDAELAQKRGKGFVGGHCSDGLRGNINESRNISGERR